MSTHSLVIAPQWIGDAVMTEPLLRTLSERGEQITVFAVPWVAPIYRAMQHITGLQATVVVPFQHGGLQWQARRGLAARIKYGEWGRFDRAYVLPNSLKSALLPWLAGVPERIGYFGEMRYGLLTKRLANPARHSRGSMVAHYLALSSSNPANPNQANSNQVTQPRLSVATSTPNGLTLIAPGAEYGSAKRWPEKHFADLAQEILKDPSAQIALLGSAKESPLCEAIRDMACSQGADLNRIQNLAGQTNLEAAIQLIAGCKQLVSNDSGLMHVAAAFGIPQVAIFGSSDPRHTPPLNDKAKVLWLKEMDGEFQGLECSPCFKRECPLEGDAHLRCLNAITPIEVAGVLQESALR